MNLSQNFSIALHKGSVRVTLAVDEQKDGFFIRADVFTRQKTSGTGQKWLSNGGPVILRWVTQRSVSVWIQTSDQLEPTRVQGPRDAVNDRLMEIYQQCIAGAIVDDRLIIQVK